MLAFPNIQGKQQQGAPTHKHTQHTEDPPTANSLTPLIPSPTAVQFQAPWCSNRASITQVQVYQTETSPTYVSGTMSGTGIRWCDHRLASFQLQGNSQPSFYASFEIICAHRRISPLPSPPPCSLRRVGVESGLSAPVCGSAQGLMRWRGLNKCRDG